ncbi:hypothetical protein GALMADRAFT_146330 [Galerina marginata CBS 339.88]|uniref:BHLH domain-containing protein n=1 Tax=Galerina marginata (strain CBS 339.88) TaxID=685588 RepID=A0A067SBS7_GALM3|nr:hypothetical protein GALMADRAFT_146330 [Galerina marginata CBS 339.88]
MTSDLGLDPSDPLNLLLHNSSQAGMSSSSSPSQQRQEQQQKTQTELEDANAEDWSKFSALWADPPASSGLGADPLKPYTDMMPMDFADLSSSMGMDMDFNPSMSIEPLALQYDPMKFANSMGFAYDDQYGMLASNELLAGQFPFTFQFGGENGSAGEGTSMESEASELASPQSFGKERRLSVTSSSSSSGASLSPVPESVPSPATGYGSDSASTSIQPKEESIPTNPFANDPAAELAERVRQSAGVMLAVPMHAQLQGLNVHLPSTLPSSAVYTSQLMKFVIVSNLAQAKLPIPRLPRHNSFSAPKSTASTSSSAASTPPPSTPPSGPFKLALNTSALPAAAEIGSTPVAATPASTLPRPKTSHTTIERRYRTNLNARIQSLRMAVPALRVLEDRDGGSGKKIKKNLKGSVLVKSAGATTGTGAVIGVVGAEGEEVDVIDERGFVDGVKVARKCSKANVLGKAVEYIRVLKKREARLKAEQAGLKTLVSGLVGGPALIREWEKEWRARFGGEERDEVEGEEGGDEGDEDSSEDEEGDDDEEGGRKRKRAKAASGGKKAAEKKKPAAAAASGGRETPLMVLASEPGAPEKRKRGRPRKVLPPPAALGAEPQDEVMHGVVPVQGQWGQQPQPQQYLLAVFALFSFFNSPLTSSSTPSTHHTHTGTVLSAHPPLAYAPEIVAQFVAPAGPGPSSPAAGWLGQGQGHWHWQEWVQLFHLAVSVLVLASFVCSWLGVGVGLDFGRVFGFGGSGTEKVVKNGSGDKSRKRLEGPAGWVGFGEESVLEGRAASLSFYERVQIYRAISTKRNASVGDLITLALVIRSASGLGGLASLKAGWVWDAARQLAQRPSSQGDKQVAEALVFEELDTLDDAAALLAAATATPAQSDESRRKTTPLEVIAGVVVKERVKRHLGQLFVRAVAVSDPEQIELEELESETESEEGEQREEEEWRKTVDAARELGGGVEELGRMFERAWKAPGGALDDADLALGGVADNNNNESVNSGLDAEIRALLAALVLYRRLFPSSPSSSSSSQVGSSHADGESEDTLTDGCETPLASSTTFLLSPPPSPRSASTVNAWVRADAAEDAEGARRRKERGRMMFVLRQVLGGRVFEGGEVGRVRGGERGGERGEEEKDGGRMGLEDARDRVVDMIVEVERRERKREVGSSLC